MLLKYIVGVIYLRTKTVCCLMNSCTVWLPSLNPQIAICFCILPLAISLWLFILLFLVELFDWLTFTIERCKIS